MLMEFRKLSRLCGEWFGLRIWLRESFERLREEPGRWVSLAAETAWDVFFLLFSAIRTIKVKRRSLSLFTQRA